MKGFRIPRRSHEAAGRRPRRRSHLVLGALGCGLLGLLLGCYLFFPTAALRERLIAEVAAHSEAQLQIADLALSFPLGLEARGVKLSSAALPMPLEAGRLELTPLWLSLFGDPGAQLDAELLGGTLQGAYHRSGAFAVQGKGLALAMPLGNLKSLTASATVRTATAEGALPLRPTTASRLQLTLDNLQLTGLKAVGGSRDVLHLGSVTLTASGQGNSFHIDQLSTTGGELVLSGSGSLLLADPPPQSRLNLALTLRPAANFDPALRGMLTMFGKPAADGTLHLHLTGSLAAPNLK